MKKPYLMRVIEHNTKQVIVWAENRDEAIETTERFCCEGKINMEDAKYSRDVFCQFKAEGYDFNIFEQYNKE